MQFSGTGVTNNAGGRRRVVFQSPTLGNNLQPTGTATVNATFRPITVNTVTSLNNGLANITQQISSALGGIVGSINAVQNNPFTHRFIRVSGLTELQNALNNLYNVDAYLRDIPEYMGQITPTVNPDGSISVDFTDQINQHVANQISARISGLLTEVSRRIGELRVEMLGGLASIPLSPLTVLTTPIASLIDSINTGGGTVNVLADVAAVQPINQLNVTQNATVPRNTTISGTQTIHAAGTQTTAARPNDMTTRGTYSINVPQTIPPFNIPAPTVDPVHAEQTTITGTYDPSAPLYVVIDGEVIELIPADPSATPGSSVSFEVAVPGDTPLAPGSVVSFYQEDPYGRPSQPVYVQVDAADTDPEEPFEIAPPVINPITSEDTTITGTKRDDTDLVLVDPNTGQQIGYVPGDPAGTGENVDFEVELPEPLAPGTVVEGYEVDQDGRRGESSFVVVDEADFEDDIDEAIENPVPAPSVNPITGADQTITGTRDPSRPIYLVVDGQVVRYLPGDPTAEPGSSVPFEVPLQVPLTPGTVVDAYQVDEFGTQER